MNKNIFLLTLASAHFTCNALDVSNPKDLRVIELATKITKLRSYPAMTKALAELSIAECEELIEKTKGYEILMRRSLVHGQSLYTPRIKDICARSLETLEEYRKILYAKERRSYQPKSDFNGYKIHPCGEPTPEVWREWRIINSKLPLWLARLKY